MLKIKLVNDDKAVYSAAILTLLQGYRISWVITAIHKIYDIFLEVAQYGIKVLNRVFVFSSIM